MDAMEKFIKEPECSYAFSKSVIDKVAKVAKIEFYKKNTLIFTEVERGEAVYIVKNGKVKISKTSPSGKEFIIKIMEAGDVFAESLVFQDVNYPAVAETLEDTYLLAVKKEKLEKVLKSDSEVAASFIQMMARRLTFLSKKMENLTFGNSVGKVIFLLLDLSKTKGVNQGDKYVLPLDLRRQDLANMINISREHFERVLAYLSKLDLIEVERDRISVKDMKSLKKLMYQN